MSGIKLANILTLYSITQLNVNFLFKHKGTKSSNCVISISMPHALYALTERLRKIQKEN